MANWICPADRFPMMGGGSLRYGERQLTVPMAFVIEHERQARSNHGQSVERLKERGGLAWTELADIIAGRRWGSCRDVDEAHFYVMGCVLTWVINRAAAAK